jgi:hypothetical protein
MPDKQYYNADLVSDHCETKNQRQSYRTIINLVKISNWYLSSINSNSFSKQDRRKTQPAKEPSLRSHEEDACNRTLPFHVVLSLPPFALPVLLPPILS